MALLLGRGSAVEWLRRNRDSSVYDVRYDVSQFAMEGSRTCVERYASHLQGLTRPIQLIVWMRRERRRSSVAQCHMLNTKQGVYPAFVVARGVFVSTPEFAFLQMANILDDERLLFLGYELCGRYGIDERVFLRPQCCDPQALVACAEAMPGVRGRVGALRVGPRVLGGAASPMEAALALVLHEPREEGGYGLAAPELNRPLPVVGRARELWEFDTITPDLLWKDAGVAIEYDSDLHHAASSRITNDAKRRNVLQELGLRVITVTSEQMSSYRDIARVASIVARHLRADVEAQSEKELGRRASYQARMRGLATHPRDLLALPDDTSAATREWHPRAYAIRRSFGVPPVGD